jgi:O-antigen polymerase
VLKYILTILVLILFGTVFIAVRDIPNGLVESKNYGFLLTSILIGFVFFVNISLTKAFQSQFSKIDIALFAFLLWVAFNSLIIKQTPYSLALEVFIFSILLALIFKQSFFSDSQYKLYFSIACLIVGGGQVILGLLQLYGYQESLHSGFKMTGSFHNPGPFGIYVAAIFVFALGHYLFTKNSVLKNIASVVCLVCILVLPSTQSRSAWVGFLGGSIYLLFIKYGLELTKKYLANKFITSTLVIALIALGVGLWNFKANSALGRMLVWRVSADMIKEKPLTGFGLGEFQNQYGFFQANFFKNNPDNEQLIALADKNNYAFNDLIQLLIENGLIGFILFAGIIFLVFFSKLEKPSDYIAPSRAGIIAILLASCFSYPFELIPMWWLLLFFISIVSVSTEKTFSIAPPLYAKLFILITFSVASVYLIYYEIKIYQAKQIWQQADFAVQQQDFGEAEKRYQKVINILPNKRFVLLSYGKALYMNGKIKQSADVLKEASQSIADPFLLNNLGDSYQALKKYDLAEQAYITASDMVPNRMYPKYLLAKMYLNTHDTLKAKQVAKKIIEMPVKVPSQATTQMKNEMVKILQ